MVPCRGCGGLFPDVDGPTHAYMLSSSGCWAAYNAVLAREYVGYGAFADLHRLPVDAFAAQHPHAQCAANARSVGYHLCRLCLILERGLGANEANAAIVTIAAQKSRFVPRTPPSHRGHVTVADVHAASGAQAHRDAVRRWAAAVSQAWAPCHALVRTWLDGSFVRA